MSIVLENLQRSWCRPSEIFFWFATLANTVREIFDVLFRNPPKTQPISDFVGSWIRKPGPRINVIHNVLT